MLRRKATGNWAEDLGNAIGFWVHFGLFSAIAIPMLVIAVIVLSVRG